MVIFIDTNIFVSFSNEDDHNHNKAKKIISDIASGKYGAPVTSDYIFDEALTVMLTKTKSIESAIKIGEYILTYVIIAVVNDIIINKAWEMFKKDNREKMSFTDCTNRVFVENFGIKNIATLDAAFKRIKTINVIGD